MRCADVIDEFTDIVMQMDDKRGLIIQPKNYLVDQTVFDKAQGKDVNHCVLLIQRNDMYGGDKREYVLGTVFLHSYYQIYDFDMDRIGLNGDYIDFDPNSRKPVEPKGGSKVGLILALILIFGAILVAVYFLLKQRQKKKLEELLQKNEAVGLM